MVPGILRRHHPPTILFVEQPLFQYQDYMYNICLIYQLNRQGPQILAHILYKTYHHIP